MDKRHILKSKWNSVDHLAGKSVCTNGGVRVCSRNGRQPRYPDFIWLGLRNQICVKENRFRHWLEETWITQIQSWVSIKPAPPSCPVCPAQLPLHQRTHPHWSDCWAPPVKIRSHYDIPAKYVNRVSTLFCILGIFYMLYISILFWCFLWKNLDWKKSKKCLILSARHAGGGMMVWGGFGEGWNLRKESKISHHHAIPCRQRLTWSESSFSRRTTQNTPPKCFKDKRSARILPVRKWPAQSLGLKPAELLKAAWP